MNTLEAIVLNIRPFWPSPTTVPHDTTISMATYLKCYGSNLTCEAIKRDQH